MELKKFMGLLEQNKGKELKFSYRPGRFVGANYHLTEVKNVYFDTTDCGGKTNNWSETHFQLWENPEEVDRSRYMTTDKALSILERVNGINPLMLETTLKIEYGNETFHTSVMPVGGLSQSELALEIELFEEKARCKANDDAQCSVIDSADEEACCTEETCC